MCGRYSFAPKAKQRKALESKAQPPAVLEISFNIAPTHAAYVIANNLPNQLQRMEWGLVPHWSADGKNTCKLINARTEGMAEKPSFRDPIPCKLSSIRFPFAVRQMEIRKNNMCFYVLNCATFKTI